MARTTSTSPEGLRALVLDADPASLTELAWALEARFFSVSTAPDGARGLELLLEHLLSLDVLVVDAALPGRDALAFAELVRRGGERDLALVVVADAPAPGLREALLAAGADAVVERREGPDAAALAAVAAVASRWARRAEPEPAGAPAVDGDGDAEPVTLIRFGLPLAGGWSMLPA